jgi:hypothetical protein
VSGHARDGSNLRRRRNVRPERPRILIVTEGELTEPQYFKGLAKTLRATGVEVCKLSVTGLGEDPDRVVREAADRSGRGTGRSVGEDAYEHVWCVIDVDDHATLSRAMRRARALSIDMAVSNPCFEIWLLWHYKVHSSHVARSELRRKLRQHGILDKSLPATFPYGSYAVAIDRATTCQSDDDPRPGRNPSSSVYKLVLLMTTAVSPR